MTPQQMHEAMAKIVDAPGYPLLKSYRKDFEVYDRQLLEASWHREGRALWVVREMGTHLINLGVHPKSSEEGRCLLGGGDRKAEYYLLTPKRVARIDAVRADTELKTFSWSMRDDVICRAGEPIAFIQSFSAGHVQDPKSRLVADAKLSALKDPSRLTHAESAGLLQFLQAESVERAQSLFCALRSATYGGVDLYALHEQRRAEWLRDEALAQARSKSRPARSAIPSNPPSLAL